tara:strand:+ start:479 stop:979 length:501 start_codon:yes stop_codon:yes gene_type:complete
MSGIIGSTGSKSGVIDGVGSAIGVSVDAWRQSGDWHDGGTLEGASRTHAASKGLAQIGAVWTNSSGEYTPPYLGVYLINAWFSFYESGDNNNDNCEGNMQFYNGSSWVTMATMRAGHQYDGTYTRGFATHSAIAHFTASTHKFRLSTGSHTNLDFAHQVTMLYLGR